VQAALPDSKVPELSEPTLNAGESIEAFLADRSAFEDFRADETGERGYGFVRLSQLALEHLLGAR
jgi:xylose isomerase